MSQGVLGAAAPKREWHNGKISRYPCRECRNRGLFLHGLMYGTSVFEGIRAYWNAERRQMYVFRLEDHFRRMLNNATGIMQFDVPYTAEQLAAATVELLRAERYRQNVYIRPIIYLDDAKIGVYGSRVAVIIMVVPFDKYNLTGKDTLDVCVTRWQRAGNDMLPPRGKIGGLYAQSYLAKREAKDNGFDDSIFLNADGSVSEGSAANIFFVKGRVLYTPDTASNILEGITRRTIMRLAADELDIQTLEGTIAPSMIYEADEMFFCGTGAEIEPIASVNRAHVVGSGGVGIITGRIQETYFGIVYGKNPKYENWLTAVY